MRGGMRGAHGARVLHEFAEAGVFALAHGPVEAHRLPSHVEHPACLLERHARCLRDLLRRRLAAEFVEQFLRGGPQLREHVDHVHRDADRAGLIGDGPRDRLSDPPGRVGRELEAATVLVLVHRPHQSRVALLDQIQEAQAAVTVFLGDRHDQPQIRRGQVPLGGLVFRLELGEHVDPPAERPRAFERREHQIAEFLAHVGTVVAGHVASLHQPQAPLEIVHAARHATEQFHQRLHPPRPQAQLFDEHQRLATAAAKPYPGVAGRLGRRLATDQQAEVGLVLLDQVFERLQVVGHPRLDLLLRQSFGERDLDRAIKRQLPLVDATERLDGGLQRIRAAQDGAAEPLACDLDPLGQRDLLGPGEQRDLSHLRQVHPNRIVAGVRRCRRDRLVTARLCRPWLGGRRCRHGDLLARFGRRVDQFDPLLLERHQEAVDFFGVDGFVGEVGVDLIKREIALCLAGHDQRRQIGIGVRA